MVPRKCSTSEAAGVSQLNAGGIRVSLVAEFRPLLMLIPGKPTSRVRVLVGVENLYPDPDPSATLPKTRRVYLTRYNLYVWKGRTKVWSWDATTRGQPQAGDYKGRNLSECRKKVTDEGELTPRPSEVVLLWLQPRFSQRFLDIGHNK